MAKEIKGIGGYDLMIGEKKAILVPLIGKEKVVDFYDTTTIAYAFANDQRPGVISFVSKVHEKVTMNFSKSKNREILSFIEGLQCKYLHIIYEDITDTVMTPTVASTRKTKLKIDDSLVIDGDELQELSIEQRVQLVNLKLQNEQLKIQNKQLDLQKQQAAATLKCPRCGSTSITGQKKGYGVVKGAAGAAVGAVVAAPLAIIGLGAGNIGRKKVLCTCMNCGHKFKAGRS